MHQSRFDEVVGGVAEIAKGIQLGSGMEAGTQMGPLVSEEQLQRVTGTAEAGAGLAGPPLRLSTFPGVTGLGIWISPQTFAKLRIRSAAVGWPANPAARPAAGRPNSEAVPVGPVCPLLLAMVIS